MSIAARWWAHRRRRSTVRSAASEPLSQRPGEVERAVRDRLYGSGTSQLLDVRPKQGPARTVDVGPERPDSSEEKNTTPDGPREVVGVERI